MFEKEDKESMMTDDSESEKKKEKSGCFYPIPKDRVKLLNRKVQKLGLKVIFLPSSSIRES